MYVCTHSAVGVYIWINMFICTHSAIDEYVWTNTYTCTHTVLQMHSEPWSLLLLSPHMTLQNFQCPHCRHSLRHNSAQCAQWKAPAPLLRRFQPSIRFSSSLNFTAPMGKAHTHTSTHTHTHTHPHQGELEWIFQKSKGFTITLFVECHFSSSCGKDATVN